jgi:hypothetical protein
LSIEVTTAMKTKTATSKPRNPLVKAALQRKAGAHRRSPSGVRYRLRMALHRELRSACGPDDD